MIMDKWFFAVGNNPSVVVEQSLQVRCHKVRPTRPLQPRKDAKDKQVADHLITFLLNALLIRNSILSLVRKLRFVSSFIMDRAPTVRY